MAFNINQFRSSFSSGGDPANPTNFKLMISKLPNLLIPEFGNMQSTIEYRCESTNVPEISLKTIERRTYGIVEKIAYAKELGPITVSIIVSDDFSERDFINTWNNIVVGTQLDYYESASGNRFLINSDVSYHNDYVGEVVIQQYKKSSVIKNAVKAYGEMGTPAEVAYTFVLQDAYPISIKEVPLSWNSNNQYIKLDITFQYRYLKEYPGAFFKKGSVSTEQTNFESTGQFGPSSQ